MLEVCFKILGREWIQTRPVNVIMVKFGGGFKALLYSYYIDYIYTYSIVPIFKTESTDQENIKILRDHYMLQVFMGNYISSIYIFLFLYKSQSFLQ
jgi:hypothetical protein